MRGAVSKILAMQRSVLLPASLMVGLLFTSSGSRAQDPPGPAQRPSAEASTVSLEKIPEQVAQIEDELLKKMDAILVLVGEEAAAKRISEAVAQSLRFTLRTSRSTPGVPDVRGLVASACIPDENQALVQAFRELETLVTVLQNRRALLRKAR